MRPRAGRMARLNWVISASSMYGSRRLVVLCFFTADHRVHFRSCLTEARSNRTAHHLEQIVCRMRRVRLGGDDGGDVPMFKASDRILSMLGAEAFEDVAADRPRRRFQRGEHSNL